MKTNFTKVIVQSLLITSIMFAVLSIFLRYVILNETTYLNILSESGTYSQVKDSVYEKIDSVLSSKNINIDIKESIITEEDIKKETDNAVREILTYLKTGENNVKMPDTSVYKQRISDALNSVIDSVIKPAGNELSSNSNLNAKDMEFTKNKVEFHEMNYVKEISRYGQDVIKIEKLMSKEEAEARAREILKQKGLTEEQAIEKAREKGITEEQALKILAGYGITIDEYESSENSSEKAGNSSDSTDSNSQGVTQNSSGETSEKGALPNNETENTIDKEQGNKDVHSKLDSIKNKLLDEANKSIDKEVEKMDFSKFLESSKIQKLAKITSLIYKLFWLFVLIPIIAIAILIKINAKGLNSSLKCIGTAFLISGLILAALASTIYMLKAYESINLGPVFIKDIISNIAKHSLIVLTRYGTITFVIGLFMFIPIIKKYLKR